jgi:hypothetical protein
MKRALTIETIALLGLGLVDFQACADADLDSVDSDPEAADLATAYEVTVGGSGDAILRSVVELPDGGILATSAYPTWILKVGADGDVDHGFGDVWGAGPGRTGSLDVQATQVWPVGDATFLAEVEDGTIRAYASDDGAPIDGFGDAGRVEAPAELLAAEARPSAGRLRLLLVRAWQMEPDDFLTPSPGPSEIELVDLDAATGVLTTLATYDLPRWTSERSDPVAVRGLFAQPDGTHVVLFSETFDGRSDVRPNGIGTTWSIFRLGPDGAVAREDLITGGFEPEFGGVARDVGGGFHVVLGGVFDGLSASSDDERVVRLAFDPATGATVDDLGAVPPPTSESECTRLATDGAAALQARSDPAATGEIELTRFADGAPASTLASDFPRRCVTSLTVGESGAIYAGAWDTTDSPSWRALLVKLVR